MADRARPQRLTLALAAALAAPLVAAVAAAPAPAAAQPADSLRLSLPEALARLGARAGRVAQPPRLAAAEAAADLARADLADAAGVARNRYLPAATASFAGQRVAQNQFAAIARYVGVVPDPAAPVDPFSQVFAAPNTRTATFLASVRPFDGGVSAARLRSARAGAAAAADGVGLARAALELDLVTRYADLHLRRRLALVADSALAQAGRALAATRRAFAAGRAAEFQVWRAEAAYEAQRPAAAEARRAERLADLALRELAELGEGPVALTTPLETWSDAAPNDRPAAAPARLAVRQLAAREQAADAARAAAVRQFLPTVELQFQHQRFAYPMLATRWGGPFFPNTVVAAVVTLPLDLTGQLRARADAAAASQRAAAAERREGERAAALEAADAALAVEAARVAWASASAGARAAERAHAVAAARYELGRASLLELADARLAWQQAEGARAQAARDRVVAEARLARLSRLPLERAALGPT